MNRIAAIALAVCAILAPAVVLAATNQYNDPAMSFTAPDGYIALPLPEHDPMNFDNPTTVAVFVKNPGKSEASQIAIRMQNFQADAAAFEMNVENDMREQAQDVFIKKTPAKLANGMPAFWQEVTIGSGFEQVKMFQYVWSDGVRGVQLTISGRYGSLDEPTAKRLLANVSAVAYPKYRY